MLSNWMQWGVESHQAVTDACQPIHLVCGLRQFLEAITTSVFIPCCKNQQHQSGQS